RRAVSRLRSTLGVETICSAAIFMRASSPFRWLGGGGGVAVRHGIGGFALHALDLGIAPRPGHVELARAGLRQRLAQKHLREKDGAGGSPVDYRIREAEGSGH